MEDKKSNISLYVYCIVDWLWTTQVPGENYLKVTGGRRCKDWTDQTISDDAGGGGGGGGGLPQHNEGGLTSPLTTTESHYDIKHHLYLGFYLTTNYRLTGEYDM